LELFSTPVSAFAKHVSGTRRPADTPTASLRNSLRDFILHLLIFTTPSLLLGHCPNLLSCRLDAIAFSWLSINNHDLIFSFEQEKTAPTRPGSGYAGLDSRLENPELVYEFDEGQINRVPTGPNLPR
jgi:hypothetical protein